MKFYKTKESNIINLDRVSAIYKDPETLSYRVLVSDGHILEFPELDEDDVDKMMEYNNFLLNL